MLTPSRRLRDAIRRRTPDRLAHWLSRSVRIWQHNRKWAAFPPPADPGEISASVPALLAFLGRSRGVLILRQSAYEATLGIARDDLEALRADLASEAPAARLREADHCATLAFTDADHRPVTVTLELYAPKADGRWQAVRNTALPLRACAGAVFTRPGTRTVSDVLEAPSLGDLAAVEPIDAVLTWVDHTDPQWQRLYAAATGTPPGIGTTDATALSRFRNIDELRFALRSLDMYAPWLRRIHIVTNCAPPAWLREAHPRIAWVPHEAVIPAAYRPTFNSHVIESCLHHVPDLTERFLYLNDDFFLMRPLEPADFFTGAGLSLSRLEPFGTVEGAPDPAHADYLNAARGGAQLIRDAIGFWPTQLHQHVPFALTRSTLAEMETRWAADYAAFRPNRFRGPGDLNVTSFLYHHYAIGTGRAVDDPREAVLIKSDDPATRDRRMLRALTEPLDFACINDGGTGDLPPGWADKVQDFLSVTFPRPAPWER